MYLHMTYPNLRYSNVLPTQKCRMLLVQVTNLLNSHYADDIIDSLKQSLGIEYHWKQSLTGYFVAFGLKCLIIFI